MQKLHRGMLHWAGPLLLVIELLLAVALAVLLARIVWLVVDPGGAVSRTEPLSQYAASSTPVQADPVAAPDYNLLVSMNPFDRATERVDEAIPDAPETKLNLVLKGVRATDEGQGTAMIVTPDNRTRIYHPGDEILDGVLLDRVFGDRVTLRKDGATEALLMDRLSVLTGPDEEEDKPEPFAGSATAPAPSPPKRASATDQFLTNMEINPVHRGQEFVGYEIGARADAGLLGRAGLQPGDIILSMNGSPVANMTPAELAGQFASSRAVRLRIDRDGKIIDQNFSLPEKP